MLTIGAGRVARCSKHMQRRHKRRERNQRKLCHCAAATAVAVDTATSAGAGATNTALPAAGAAGGGFDQRRLHMCLYREKLNVSKVMWCRQLQWTYIVKCCLEITRRGRDL